MRCVLVLAAALGAGAGCRIHFDALAGDASSDAGPRVIEIEAESGLVTPAFAIDTADDVTYVIDNNPRGMTGPGSVSFTVIIDEPGAYYVWGRTLAVDSATNSFDATFDSVTARYVTSACEFSAVWQWRAVRGFLLCPELTPLVAFELDTGSHSLTLTSREGGSLIDRMILTDDPSYIPVD